MFEVPVLRIQIASLFLIAACNPPAIDPGDANELLASQTSGAFVQANASGTTNNSSGVSVAFSSSEAQHDLNVVVVAWRDTTAQVTTVRDSAGNTYTRAAGPTQGTDKSTGEALTQSLYYAANIAPSQNNVVEVLFSTDAVDPKVRIAEYTGVETSAPLDVATGQTGTSASPSAPPATVSGANELLVAALGSFAAPSPGANYTSRILQPDGMIEDRTVSSAGAYGATASVATSSLWVMQVAAFVLSQPTADAGSTSDAGHQSDGGTDGGATSDGGREADGGVDAGTTSGNVALNVLLFPGASTGSDSKAIGQYLMNNPTVHGASIAIEWSDVDDGSGTFDWSTPQADMAPWVSAGKKVNLIVWANADNGSTTCGTIGQYGENGTGNCAIPSYVWTALGPSNYAQCDTQYGTQRIPNYLNAAFQKNYQTFIGAVLAKYGSNPNIGYIRFGLGHGGESIPVSDWNDSTSVCGKAFASWGVTISTWESYLQSMVDYEAGKDTARVQLMVGITPMGGDEVPDFLAEAAEKIGVGFGSQGLQAADLNNCKGSTADWCELFQQFSGDVPLELQTVGQSCPNGGCSTGSLTQLIPYAVAHDATVFELYYEDWLVAYDPSYPGYYAPYQQTLEAAARGK